MDLDNLEIIVRLKEDDYNEAREKYLNENPDVKAQEEKEETETIEKAKLQIADYIKTFKRLPSKKFWFNNDFFVDWRVTYCSIEPLSNKVYCYLEFS